MYITVNGHLKIWRIQNEKTNTKQKDNKEAASLRVEMPTNINFHLFCSTQTNKK